MENKNYEEAIYYYTEALQFESDKAYKIYANRSTAYFSISNYEFSLLDAEKCIELSPKWYKGYIRKAGALSA